MATGTMKPDGTFVPDKPGRSVMKGRRTMAKKREPETFVTTSMVEAIRNAMARGKAPVQLWGHEEGGRTTWTVVPKSGLQYQGAIYYEGPGIDAETNGVPIGGK